MSAQDVVLSRPTSTSRFLIDADFRNEPLTGVLDHFALKTGATFRVVGDRTLPVTFKCQTANLDDALEQLTFETGLLAVRIGQNVVLYSDGAEKELGDEPVAYLYQMRHGIVTEDEDSGLGFESNFSPTLLKYNLLKAVDVRPMRESNGILLRGKLADVRAAVDLLRVLDQPRHMVMVEVLIVEYIHGDRFDWRFNLTNARLTTKPPPSDASLVQALEGVSLIPELGASAATITVVGRLASQFKTNLTSLVANNHARIVTNPRMTVENGQKGTLTLDETFYFLTSNISPSSSKATAESLTAKTEIVVTPTVISPEQILLDLTPTLGTFSDSVSELATSTQIQRLRDTETTTVTSKVAMQDGETLILGGLVRRQADRVTTGFGALHRIPGLGRFFKDEIDRRQYSEVVLYVTPRLIRVDGVDNADNLDEHFRRMDELNERTRQLRETESVDRLRQRKSEVSNRKRWWERRLRPSIGRSEQWKSLFGRQLQNR